MTDLLLRPEDTGDIPTGVGESTRRLNPPALRRPAVDETYEIPVYHPTGFVYLDPARTAQPATVLGLVGGCRTVVPDGEDILRPSDPGYMPPQTPPTPDPVPPPPPPTPSDALWECEVERLPRGRHRRPSRWDWLTTPLSAGMQIVRAAWSRDGGR